MSSMGLNVPEPSEVNYHADLQAQRVEKALKMIDPGDVLAVIDSRIAAEASPALHPLFKLVCWHLEKKLTPLDGAEFFDRFNQLVMAAVDTCLDELLAMGEV